MELPKGKETIDVGGSITSNTRLMEPHRGTKQS